MMEFLIIIVVNKLLLSIIFINLLGSCSSGKLDVFNPENFKDSLDSIKTETKIDYGPTQKTNTGFIDKTVEYGLEGIEATNFNLVDIDRDGFTDLVVIPDYYSQPIFYRFNIHSNKFEKFKSPFKDAVKASYILFYDLDQDQILDAVVGVLNQDTEFGQDPIRIFKGNIENNEFVLREQVGIIPVKPAPSATVGLIDFDLDGNLDLFIGNWFQKIPGGVIPYRDYLLEFKEGKYIDSSHKLLGELDQNEDRLMYVNATPTYASQICDIDQNGFPDIITTATNGYPNRLWMNRYKVREVERYFEDFGRTSLFGGDTEGNLTPRGNGRSFSAACADYNEDGIMDLFLGEVSHRYDNEMKDKSSILTGTTFKFPPFYMRTEYFLDSDEAEGHQSDKRAIWFDYDNDGLLDLLVENSGFPPYSRLILFKQYPDHSFENKSKELGIDIINPLSTVIGDFNRDGRLDIITAQSNLRDAKIKKRIYLFENQVQEKIKPLRFYLRGQKSNYHGLNATVLFKVVKDNIVRVKSQVVSYSYGGLPPQNEEGLLLSLNEGEELVSVTVRWPYTKSLNQSRAGLEKTYRIKKDYQKAINITLCENGDYLVGRLSCH